MKIVTKKKSLAGSRRRRHGHDDVQKRLHPTHDAFVETELTLTIGSFKFLKSVVRFGYGLV